MKWPEFYFARHGQTEWNRERRYQGSMDIPLNATGQAQADANGTLLRDLLDRAEIDPTEADWFASPLSRATETMERMRAPFAGQTLKPVIPDNRLREISFGQLEGKLHADLPPELSIAPGSRPASYWNHRPPEGENYQDVADRLLSFFEELPERAIVVAHGGVLRVLRHLVEGTSKEEAVNWFPPQGVIAHFHDGRMHLHRTELAADFS